MATAEPIDQWIKALPELSGIFEEDLKDVDHTIRATFDVIYRQILSVHDGRRFFEVILLDIASIILVLSFDKDKGQDTFKLAQEIEGINQQVTKEVKKSTALRLIRRARVRDYLMESYEEVDKIFQTFAVAKRVTEPGQFIDLNGALDLNRSLSKKSRLILKSGLTYAHRRTSAGLVEALTAATKADEVDTITAMSVAANTSLQAVHITLEIADWGDNMEKLDEARREVEKVINNLPTDSFEAKFFTKALVVIKIKRSWQDAIFKKIERRSLIPPISNEIEDILVTLQRTTNLTMEDIIIFRKDGNKYDETDAFFKYLDLYKNNLPLVIGLRKVLENKPAMRWLLTDDQGF